MPGNRDRERGEGRGGGAVAAVVASSRENTGEPASRPAKPCGSRSSASCPRSTITPPYMSIRPSKTAPCPSAAAMVMGNFVAFLFTRRAHTHLLVDAHVVCGTPRSHRHTHPAAPIELRWIPIRADPPPVRPCPNTPTHDTISCAIPSRITPSLLTRSTTHARRERSCS